VVSGIGCTGRAAGYVNLDSYHSTHGRAIAFATGLKLANQDLVVTVISGDGDLSTIGGNHLIHAARRNIDINVIMVNNFTYGMTGGQFGATTPTGAISSTSAYGNHERPFKIPELMAACGASYVARWTSLHVQQMEESIQKMMDHSGFCITEIISPCPTRFGRRNKIRTGIEMMKWYEEKSVKSDGIALEMTYADVLKDEDFPIGEFVSNDYASYLQSKIALEGGIRQ
ncbi:MAG: thiamine pyrophosphate-dependent enzyme, partial [Candidatus Kariarchaeaceae archaeon]|jgi:2-oxoglutarate ferredoxin oxidoreductase subunit beta